MVTGAAAKKPRSLRCWITIVVSVQLPARVKLVWSGELEIACSIEVKAPGVAPEQSMAAEFSVWANDRVEVERSNRRAHNTLGPKERSFMIFYPHYFLGVEL